MIFAKHGNLKHKYGNRGFWTEDCYVTIIGVNIKVIKEYIINQEREVIIKDNLSNNK